MEWVSRLSLLNLFGSTTASSSICQRARCCAISPPTLPPPTTNAFIEAKRCSASSGPPIRRGKRALNFGRDDDDASVRKLISIKRSRLLMTEFRKPGVTCFQCDRLFTMGTLIDSARAFETAGVLQMQNRVALAPVANCVRIIREGRKADWTRLANILRRCRADLRLAKNGDVKNARI